jgi:hypothetical protein
MASCSSISGTLSIIFLSTFLGFLGLISYLTFFSGRASSSDNASTSSSETPSRLSSEI